MARNQAEFRLHCFVTDYLRKSAWPDVIWFHPPNGENRSAITGARLKRLGTIRGVPDFVFIRRDGSPAFLELKAPKGRLSPAQLAFLGKAHALKVPYRVARDGDDVRAILSEWGITRESYRRPSAIVGELIHGEGPLT